MKKRPRLSGEDLLIGLPKARNTECSLMTQARQATGPCHRICTPNEQCG